MWIRQSLKPREGIFRMLSASRHCRLLRYQFVSVPTVQILPRAPLPGEYIDTSFRWSRYEAA
jgi:hypothetical protein